MTKRLYKDFAKVVLPGWVQSKAYPNAFLSNTEEDSAVYLDQWQTVIELARVWTQESNNGLAIFSSEDGWFVQIDNMFAYNAHYEATHKSLPIAVMRAIVEAAKGAGR